MAGAIFCLVIGLGFFGASFFAQTQATEFVCYAVSLIFLFGAAVGSDEPNPKEGDSYIP
jgi:hypothetical protein